MKQHMRFVLLLVATLILSSGCGLTQPAVQSTPTPSAIPAQLTEPAEPTAATDATATTPAEPTAATDATATTTPIELEMETIAAETVEMPSAMPTIDLSGTSEAAASSPTVSDTPTPGEPIAAPDAIDASLPASVVQADMPSGGAHYTFAQFQAGDTQVDASLSQPAIAADLSNVEMPVLLTTEQQQRLADIGFVVSPGDTKEFYELYERARYNYIPIFITSDSLLHVYHLLFDKTLRRTETEFLLPMLSQLDWEMLNTSIAQYEQLRGTAWEEAARRNAAYFAVPVKILNPDWSVPQGLQELVEPELASIQAHDGIGPSSIFPNYPEGEDWSQYVPRGHYTTSEDLQRYFVAMMWHGRMTFRVKDSIETQQAALLTYALRQTTVDDMPAKAVWENIYDPTVFFVGRSDDLTPTEYNQALDVAYGTINSVDELTNEASFVSFQSLLADMEAPEILGMVISRDEQDVEDETKGLRFMGQRFVPDAFVFRQLVDRNVPDRMLPKALDFFAALGSERALEHLEASGDTAMENYTDNMNELRDIFAGYDEQTWTQNLYWSWIHTLRPLLEPVGEGYPTFMQSDAWLDKQLTTGLGSWTELKRDTILYAKQVYVEMGAGPLPPPEPEQPKGYVEPVPTVFARIAALAQMTIDGLEQRGMLLEDDKTALEAMVRLAERLQTIAEKELRGETLSDDEYDFIRFYGAQIEGLTFAADDEATYRGGGGSAAGGEDLQAAVVADVATDPNGFVLEEGVGRVFDIYVVVPIEDRLVVAKGGVFSHYEFTQPLSNRLTDEEWRQMLDVGEAPEMAAWKSSYIVEQTPVQGLADTILTFNDALVEAFWFTDAELVAPYLGDQELEDTRVYIEQELTSQDLYMGMKRHSLEFRSFDFQDEDHATVTTRERWSEEKFRGSPYLDDMAEQEQPEKVSERGPYTLDVTYTMERQDDTWIITEIVVESGQQEE